MKKSIFTLGLACSVALGVVFSLTPQTADAQLQEIIDGGSVKCHHNANGGGITNFCNGTKCEQANGTGSRFRACG